jgi:hypothetical protein
VSDKGLSKKQELLFRIFSALAGKQEIGKLGAAEVEQLMQISEAVAEKILAVKS